MKLNIGAGGTRIDGFSAIDLDPSLSPDIAGDFRTMTFESIEEIYASHILEHFFFGEAEHILHLWRDWLTPGGILWLAVPDFGEIARLYVVEGEAADHLFGLLYGGSDRPERNHHSGWTREHLTRVLNRCGFDVLGTFEPWVQNADANGADWSGAWYRKRNGQDVGVSLNLHCRKGG